MLSCFFSCSLRAQDPAVTIHWNDTTVVSKTTPALQVVEEVCWTYNQGRELRERQ
ncbi:hypothetical protein [Chitinophaga cymbidii]|uniref:hypothetical protein n=1 Tax=Chitinophaga cymbidii TaxID=1096750 RepID=UPI00164A2B3E|nr:hypothetical protein [Chitinophaga cymbidii]